MNNNGIISAPVSLSDVSLVLGENSLDVATLCTSGKIMKWAKYKPYNINQPNDINDTQRKSINFGLTPPVFYTSKDKLIEGLKNGQSSWIYTAPSTTCMKRLTDFVGYVHSSTSPFGHIPDTIDIIMTTNTTVSIRVMAPSPSSELLQLKDFNKTNEDFSKWYFSILICNDSKNWIASADEQGVPMDVSFGSAIGTYDIGTYKAIPFLSSHKWNPATITPPTSFKACGIEDNGSILNIISESSLYVIKVTWFFTDTTYKTINYNIKITNTTSAAKTLSQVLLLAAKDISGTGAITIKSLGDIVVAADSTETLAGTITSPNLSSQFTYLGVKYSGLSSINWQPQIIPFPDSGSSV